MGLMEQGQNTYTYDVLHKRSKELHAIMPMVGTEYYTEMLAIDSELRLMEQDIPVHHSSKAWWDGVHEMD